MTILLFVIILGVLVFVHEFGHFLVAKYSGIRVDEFAVGFPPRLFSKKVGETVYALNLVPFGGYVKIHGEDPANPSTGNAQPDLRSFATKNRLVQAFVLVGGVAMNFVFAWFLFSAIFMSGATVSRGEYPGYELRDERLMIVDVFPDSPALKSGFKAGDVIIGLRGGSAKSNSPTLEETQKFISSQGGKEITVDITRGSSPFSFKVTPKQGVVGEKAGIGVSLDRVGELKLPLVLATVEGAKKTYDFIILTAEGIGKFLHDIFTFRADFTSISGPVGIANLVGDARALGWFYVVSFTALISINLGVINLIPFPALDGGRLFFVAIEAIIRRPLPARFVRMANGVGFSLLIMLLLVVTYRDVLKLF